MSGGHPSGKTNVFPLHPYLEAIAQQQEDQNEKNDKAAAIKPGGAARQFQIQTLLPRAQSSVHFYVMAARYYWFLYPAARQLASFSSRSASVSRLATRR